MNLEALIDAVLGPTLIGVPLGIALIGGLWAERRLRTAPQSERPELQNARTVARAISLLCAIIGAGFLGFGAVIGTGWTGSVNYAVVLAAAALGSTAGVVGWLAALLGYAVAARPGVGRVAISGALAGPLVLAGSIALGGWVSQALANARHEAVMDAEQARDDFWRAQSANLHITIENVTYDSTDFRDVDTGLMRTGIQRMRFILVLHADVDLPVDPAPEAPKYGPLVLAPVDPPVRGCVLHGAVPLSGRSSLPAGADIRIEVEALTPEGCANFPAPGAFDVGLNLQATNDGSVGSYVVSTRLVVGAD